MSASHDVTAEKVALRTRIRALRAALEIDACIKDSEKLAVNLLALPELTSARVVLAYHAMPEEIDPAPTLRTLGGWGVTIAYPRIEAPGVIALHTVNADTVLEAGPFGLSEPPVGAPRIEPESVDAVLVPGVAFDPTGGRLGVGGGYYDRLMPQLRSDCALIGIAFDEQVLDQVPRDVHDVSVHLVVTPTRILGPAR